MSFSRTAKILFILLFPLSHFGQIKVHKHLTTEDGLVHNKILSMFQDSKGYIWFGTMGGVSKWDGNNFTNFTKSNGLPSAAILDIIESPKGSILLSTYRKGFIKLKNGRIDTVNKQDGLSSNMVNRFKIIDDKLIVISNIAQEYSEGKFISLKKKFDKLEGPLGDLIIENDKTIFASSRTKGFYVKDGTTNKFFTEKDGLLSNEILRIEKDSNGYILIATVNGINKYKDGKIFALEKNGKVIKVFVTDILVTKDGTNYYACNKGLIIEKNNSLEILNTESGLLENNVDQLLEDHNGTIYLGYEHSGVSIYNPNRFSNYKSIHNSTEFIANSIIQKADSSILLGTQNGITIISSDGIKKLNRSNGLNYNNIFSMAKNKNQEIYIGASNSFSILKDKKITSYYMGDESHREIYDVVISSDGDVIMAVRREGLQIFTSNKQVHKNFLNSLISTSDSLTKNKFRKRKKSEYGTTAIKTKQVKGGIINSITLLNGLQNTWILDLLMSSDSSLVIGYHGEGASFYKNGKFTHFKEENGLTDEIVTTIFEHTNGTYWFGTRQGGITIYDKGVVDTINVTNGLSSNDIRGIVQLKDKVYVTTSKGLNIIIKYSDGYFIRQIKDTDGLVSNNCKPNSILLDNENNIWIGTNEGISKYNPQADKIINSPPKVYFIGLEVFNEEYPFNVFLKEKELQYNQNYLRFKFNGLNLSSPKEIKYKYRLSNVDKNWVESMEGFANYTSLDNGEYTFEVKARNEWGYWSKPTPLTFVINPAWWQTWWFYLLLTLSIATLIAFIASYRYRNLLAVEKIRTKISADLHDSIGSGLSEITILSELLTPQVNQDNQNVKDGLKNISVTARSLVASMSDIVWLVNPSQDSLRDLFLRLQDSYHEVLSQSNIAFSINNIESLREIKLPMTFRQNLFLLFKEATNNSLKYSSCKNIILDIETKSKRLIVKYFDDGIGFDIDRIKKGNGLNNMYERAKAINGKLEFKSQIGKGTSIIFEGTFNKLKIAET